MLVRTIISAATAASAFLLATAGASAQDAGEQAGVAAAVRGNVVLVAAAPQQTKLAVGENVRSGDPIFLGDTIETGPGAGLQIMLMDETIFTIGPDAALVIDEFVYDPETNAGKVTASVLKGAFRFVSGRVAKEEPRNMNVKTPVGTIGIRGTSAAGRVIPPDPADSTSETTADIVLLGPGADNNADERAGRIIVSNADTSVEISRSGFGTTIAGADLPPTIPVRFEQTVVAGLTGNLGTTRRATPAAARPAQPGTSPGGGNGQDGPNTGDQQGQNDQGSGNQGANQPAGNRPAGGPTIGGPQPAGPATATPGGRPAGRTGPVIGLGQATALSGQNLGAGVVNVGAVSQVSNAQNAASQQLLAAVEESGSKFSNTIASFDQLRSIETGTATYNFGRVALQAGAGASAGDGGGYDTTATINFSARTIDLTISNVLYTINTVGGNSFAFTDGVGQNGDDTFSDDTGIAKNTWNNTDNAAEFTTAPPAGHTVEITGQINNNVDTGVIAASASVHVKVTAGAATISGGAKTPKK